MQVSLGFRLLSSSFSVFQSQLTWNMWHCMLFSEIWNSWRSTVKCLHCACFTIFSLLRCSISLSLTPKTYVFVKTVIRLQPLSIFTKKPHLRCLGFKYVSKYVKKFKYHKNMKELSKSLLKSTKSHKIY